MADSIFEQAIEAILKGDADKATEIAKRGIDVCTANVCSKRLPLSGKFLSL